MDAAACNQPKGPKSLLGTWISVLNIFSTLESICIRDFFFGGGLLFEVCIPQQHAVREICLSTFCYWALVGGFSFYTLHNISSLHVLGLHSQNCSGRTACLLALGSHVLTSLNTARIPFHCSFGRASYSEIRSDRSAIFIMSSLVSSGNQFFLLTQHLAECLRWVSVTICDTSGRRLSNVLCVVGFTPACCPENHTWNVDDL